LQSQMQVLKARHVGLVVATDGSAKHLLPLVTPSKTVIEENSSTASQRLAAHQLGRARTHPIVAGGTARNPIG